MFNEIDGDFNDVAIRTFKVGLPVKHNLRKSLTKKPVRSVHQLMDRIDEYRKTSNKGKERLRLSLRIGEISGRTDTIIAGPEGILLDNLSLQLLRWLTRYSESQYIKS